ncbi:MAG: Trk system potassium transporter TrkA [Phycisphaeraceae bacterium]|nr:MAG: Trk system potassium transporter TrkA [Phycisphaeraceae bacterium]
MYIVICGAGQVGRHAAEVLVAANHRVTVIDQNAAALRAIQDTLDAATLLGSCTDPGTLLEAGAARADLAVAATSIDEVNLLGASLAKGLGAKSVVARVHHRAFFQSSSFDYALHLGIDRLICPEFVTAHAIARTLRNPGAIAIESFARGRIEIQEFPVAPDSPVIGRPLSTLRLPPRTRLVGISRNHFVFLPRADSEIEPGDVVILLSDKEHFDEALSRFGSKGGPARQRVVIMGGPAMAVWLCRALHSRRFSVRVFEERPERAEELADKLDWVTVINADPIDAGVFADEAIGQVDTFIALTDDDERNILGSAWVKTRGVKQTIVVVQRPQYGHLLEHVGIDRAFSPRITAVGEILNVLERKGLRRLTSLAEGVLDVFRGRVEADSPIVDRPLRDVPEFGTWVVVAVEHGDAVEVPTAETIVRTGDTILAVGPHGTDEQLADLLATRVVRSPALVAPA